VPCNVFGTDEAIAALASDVEEQRARDPGFALAFAISDAEGPTLDIDPREALWVHDVLMAVSRRHPNVAIAVADVGEDEESDSVMHASVFLYTRGRRRIAKSFSFDRDHGAGLERLEAMLYRLERRWRRRYSRVTVGAPPPRAARRA
jgi:hypothetical protein